MDANAFDLTPEQKDLLVALADETGKSIPALLAEALEGLQDQVQARPCAPATARNGDPTTPPADHEAPPRHKHLGAIAADLLHDVPDDDFAQLPVDGAEQHDHYIYGTPKRPA
jgi:hypothetical protein